MDQKTIEVYNLNIENYEKRHSKMVPTRLYHLAQTFFKKGSKTLDLGCGIGRDTKWLNDNEYPADGIDASEEMLKVARKNFPQGTFNTGSLPDLNINESYENIFCCAVLMHVPRAHLVSSVISILKALKPEGRIVLSYKSVTDFPDGRLFEDYKPGQVAQLFESLGGKVLFMEKEDVWNNLVVEKQDINKRDGIRLIQDIITRDKKVATYKFALIRALCEISRYESHIVTWYREGDLILVPMQRIAARWVLYYWPLVREGLKQTTSERMAFEEQLKALPYKAPDMVFLKNALDEASDKTIQSLLTKVSNTIKVGPVKYAGGGENDIFDFVSALDASVYPDLKYSKNGIVTVPISLWRDISLFSHWIEDSLAIQWAELSSKINKDGKFGTHLDLITKSVQDDKRDTLLIRKILKNKEITCVWTGRKVTEFDVDHVIPWTLWRNNDLWNLLPAKPTVNNQKRDQLPSPKLIAKNIKTFRYYWEIYEENFPELFQKQIQKALGITGHIEKESIEALEQTLIRVHSSQGGNFWQSEL